MIKAYTGKYRQLRHDTGRVPSGKKRYIRVKERIKIYAN
jgi:hypothetical protein